MPTPLTAESFVERLMTLAQPGVLERYQKSFRLDAPNRLLGVPMGSVFALAREFIEMPLDEVEKLLDSPLHHARVGAMSIMDKQARSKRIPDSRRKDLFDLYVRRLDSINNWDLVDLAAPYVVGGYLADKPRDVLYELAASPNTWARRTAITATAYFLRQGDLDDTFLLAEMLLHDPHDLVQKPVGSWLREAGKQDQARLLAFLDRHAAAMPRVTLRFAIEHLDKAQRDHYLELKLKTSK
jgi:3-methyladenine DNA glycosylase AlkD